MSEISVIGNAALGNTHSAAPTNTTHTEAPSTPVDCTDHICTDSVEISKQAVWLEKIHQLPAVRQHRIDSLKQAIASNDYLDDEKLHIAYDRLIEEIAK